MAFKLSVTVLDSTAKAYVDAITAFCDELENCDKAVKALSESGWSGNAEAAFYEKFFVWIQKCITFNEKLSHMSKCLIACGELAEILKGQYMAVPGAIGAPQPGDCDIIFLDKNSCGAVLTNASNLSNTQWTSIKNSLNNALSITGQMQHRLFSIDVDPLITSLKAKFDNTIQFSEEFSDYVNNVTAFESEAMENFNYLSDENFNSEKGDELVGWTDSAGLSLDLTSIGLRTYFKVPKTIVVDGKYVRMKGYIKDAGFAPKYLLGTIKSGSSPKATLVYRLNKVLNVAGWVMVGVSAVSSGYEEYTRNPYMPTERKVINTAVATSVDVGISVGAGAVAGAVGGAVTAAVAGTKIGAVLGSFIPVPVVGNVVGAVVGAGVGFLVGIGLNWLSDQKFFEGGTKSAKDKIADGLNSAWDWITGEKATGTVTPQPVGAT
jgi:uncharacterized protein YukE